jgi:hypothetical protein
MLGSKSVPVWFDKDEEGREPFVQSFDDVWLEMVKKLFEDGDESFSESEITPFWQTYYTLGTQAKDNSFRLVLTTNLRRVQRDVCQGLGPIMETLQAPSTGIYLDHESRHQSQTKSAYERP